MVGEVQPRLQFEFTKRLRFCGSPRESYRTCTSCCLLDGTPYSHGQRRFREYMAECLSLKFRGLAGCVANIMNSSSNSTIPLYRYSTATLPSSFNCASIALGAPRSWMPSKRAYLAQKLSSLVSGHLRNHWYALPCSRCSTSKGVSETNRFCLEIDHQSGRLRVNRLSQPSTAEAIHFH